MLKIGLTGGIGCGKTTVTHLFQELNVPVIDADVIAHKLVEIGKPALHQIEELFGHHVINNDGSLNRATLRTVIFNDSVQKTNLENLLHPLVYNEIENEINLLHTPYCIISIPLLFETNWEQKVDRVLTIDCSVETQIQRLLKRENMNLEIIDAIIASQVPRSYRVSHANDVLNNEYTYDILAEDVKKLHNLYLSISSLLG